MELKNKKELIDKANNELNKLFALVESLPENIINKQMNFDGLQGHWQRDKNSRDVISHLYEWNNLLITWVSSNLKGIRTNYLPDGYTWSDYSGLNIEFWKKHQQTSINEAKRLFKISHETVIELVNSLSNEQLMDVSKFPWTENEMLMVYIDETTGNHYLWALDKINKHVKNCLD